MIFKHQLTGHSFHFTARVEGGSFGSENRDADTARRPRNCRTESLSMKRAEEHLDHRDHPGEPDQTCSEMLQQNDSL